MGSDIKKTSWATWVAGIALLAAISLWLRPLVPVDETRYATVAWEMWQGGQFILPSLNGELYEHKPPLLFWLVHAGWAITGVNETWPRLIGPLALLACLWLLTRLASRLWPGQGRVGPLASLVCLGTGSFAVYGTAFMFDLPLLALLCLAWISLHDAVRRGRWRDWLGFGLAFAAAMLTKGPVAAVYLLPPLLAMKLWAPSGSVAVQGWRLATALALAVALPVAWLLLADHHSGGELLHRVIHEQTLGRVRGELGHPRPVYWYLPWLPLLALPWVLWPPAWRALRATASLRGDRGRRFVAVTALAGLLVLSLVGGKQVHYLLPLLALSALWLARGLLDQPGTHRVALVGLSASLLVMAGSFLALGARYDLSEASRYVARQQDAGRPVAYVGKYQGEFGFLGRLRQPVVELRPAQAEAWARRHPDALVVARAKRLELPSSAGPEFRQPYKSGEMLMYRAGDVVRTGGFRDPQVAAHVDSPPMEPRDTTHWRDVYRNKPADAVSWYRPRLDMSLRLLEDAGLSPQSRVIDVGGGASTLVDDLQARGLSQVTVLDLADEALDVARQRLGTRGAQVRWLAADVTQCDLPEAAFDLWHDRAVLHFLVDPEAAAACAAQARRCLAAGGHAVIGGFAPGGPERCSGLVVARRSPEDVAALFGPEFSLVREAQENHQTPAGATQAFSWAVLRKTL